MVEKVKLKDYQKSILDKLDAIRDNASNMSSSYLGVEISGRNVLVNLLDITETLVVADIKPIPLVKPWLLGITNVRGVLYAINDLGQLLDSRLTEISSNTRVLLINADIASNTGILVNRLIGLRSLAVLKQRDGVEESLCFKQKSYEDDDGKVWYVLDCEKFVSSTEFEVSYVT